VGGRDVTDVTNRYFIWVTGKQRMTEMFTRQTHKAAISRKPVNGATKPCVYGKAFNRKLLIQTVAVI
jgi:hypothetical protein